jgi:hypothetical protein
MHSSFASASFFVLSLNLYVLLFNCRECCGSLIGFIGAQSAQQVHQQFACAGGPRRSRITGSR